MFMQKIDNNFISMYCNNFSQGQNNHQIRLKMIPVTLQSPSTNETLSYKEIGSQDAENTKYSLENSPELEGKEAEGSSLVEFTLELKRLPMPSLASTVSESPRTPVSKLSAHREKFSKIKARQLELKKKAESILSNSSSNSSPLKNRGPASQTPTQLSLPSPRKQKKPNINPNPTITVHVSGREQIFTILRFVDQGCFGKVYLAQHSASGMVFCMKVIDRTFLDETNLMQLIREIKIQSCVNHPNIVRLYAYFFDEGQIYLLLEPCLGGNLFKLMGKSSSNSLPEKDVKKYIKEVAKAVEYLHNLNVIHRDIKPQNVLIHENSAKLCDFGWAVHSPLLRQTQCGTPLYVPPEVIRSEQYDSKIDVWCLGVLTYQLLFGQPPFKIRTMNDMVKIVDQEVYYPAQSGISWAAIEFMKGCLQKVAVKRFEIRQVLDHQFLIHGGGDRFRSTVA